MKFYKIILRSVLAGVLLAIVADISIQLFTFRFIALRPMLAMPDTKKCFSVRNGWGHGETRLALEAYELHFFDWSSNLPENDAPASIANWALKDVVQLTEKSCVRLRMGFPFLSTEAVFVDLPDERGPSIKMDWTSCSLVLMEGDWRKDSGPWMLVWGPRSIPFAGNVLFYSVLSAVFLLLKARWLRVRRIGRHQCGACGYDLTAITGPKCPECGHLVANQQAVIQRTAT